MTARPTPSNAPGPSATARVNAGFDDVPETYDELRAAGHMSRRRLEVFLELLGRGTGTVVELGSGTGTLLRELAARLPDRRFIGVEPLANYVSFARERAAADGLSNVTFQVGTGECLSSVVGEDCADAVLSVDALHHVSDVGQTVAEVARVARPGSHWHAMEPNRLHPYVWAYHVLTPGERTFPYRAFVRRAAGAGWRLADRRMLFLYPSGVRRVPPRAAQVELRLERVPILAGGVLLDLVRD